MSNFNNFRTLPVANYAAQFNHKGVVWVFQHIPKTAGSSLTAELNQILPPYRNIFASHAPGDADNLHDAMMTSVDEFLADHQTTHYRSASGHLRLPHMRRIQESLPNMRVVTFLREPAKRLISDYRYAKTPRHPTFQEFSDRFPTIEDYVNDPASQNKMWKFLAPVKLDADEQALKGVFNRASFIGTLETLADDWAFFSALSGHPKVMSSRVNVTAKRSDNKVKDDEDLLALIREKNEKDYVLYDTVMASLTERRDEMNAYIDDRRRMWAGEIMTEEAAE